MLPRHEHYSKAHPAASCSKPPSRERCSRNSAPSSASTVRGAEGYCSAPPGAPSRNGYGEGASAGFFPGNRFNDRNVYLAYLLQKSLTKGPGAEDRGVHRARFVVLRDATMPAVLIEGGFLSHPVEGRNIAD